MYPSEGRADDGVLDGVLGPADGEEGSADFGDEVADEPEPIDVPEPPVTGDAVVDEAVRLVAKAVLHPLEDQVPVYDAVHRGLQDRLADVED